MIGFNEKYSNSVKKPESESVEIEEELENKGAKATPTAKKPETPSNQKESSSANQPSTQPPMMKSPLMAIKQFIKQLSSPFYDGRILLNIDQASRSTSSLKYILLNPSVCFEEIASQARAIILAGGTMKPVN